MTSSHGKIMIIWFMSINKFDFKICRFITRCAILNMIPSFFSNEILTSKRILKTETGSLQTQLHKRKAFFAAVHLFGIPNIILYCLFRSNTVTHLAICLNKALKKRFVMQKYCAVIDLITESSEIRQRFRVRLDYSI